MVVIGPMFHESHPVEGQTPQFKGSMMIFRGTSAEEVREILNNDVYAKNEVWDMENTQIIPVSLLNLPKRH